MLVPVADTILIDAVVPCAIGRSWLARRAVVSVLDRLRTILTLGRGLEVRKDHHHHHHLAAAGLRQREFGVVVLWTLVLRLSLASDRPSRFDVPVWVKKLGVVDGRTGKFRVSKLH